MDNDKADTPPIVTGILTATETFVASISSGKCLRPTTHLRIIRSPMHRSIVEAGPDRLQQYWQDTLSGVGEWRDVEISVRDLPPGPSPD